MKIYAFGDERQTGYRFDVLKASDDWMTTRASVAKNIGGSDGSFDFLKTINYPVNPLTISKTFDLPAYYQFAGAGTAEPNGSGVISGASSNFDGEVLVSDRIIIGKNSYTVISVTSDTVMGVSETGGVLSSQAYKILRPSILDYDTLDIGIDWARLCTIARGESKLWAQLRDGSYVWTWAKCVSCNANEKRNTRLSIPVSLSFYCRTGIWYSETQHSHVFTGTGTYSAANAGNYPALVSIDALAGVSAMTDLDVTCGANEIVWAGNVSANKHLLITSDPNSIKDDGVGDYSGVTFYGGANRYSPWFYIQANSSATMALGGISSAASVTFSWNDTYLL